MRTFAVLLLVFSACFSVECFAQAPVVAPVATSAGGAAANLYRNEAIVWEHFDTSVHMHADGTGDRTIHIVARLQSEGAARQLSVLSVTFASAYETGTIDYVRVHKPDGTVVETPTGDAIEMPSPVTREAPLYSDLKEKQLPVRSVAAGDVLDYQFSVVRTRAEAPGEFWGAEHFLVEGGVVLSQTLTLEVPDSKYVQVWDPNHPTTPKVHDGLRTYSWSTSQLKPTPKAKDASAQQVAGQQGAGQAANAPDPDKIHDPDEDEDGKKLPSVAWTTFHSWAAVGAWYRGLATGRADATTALTARANELTKDEKTPEEQVRAIYAFVAGRIRYVGIDFGVGRYQPHMAEEVVDHEYGDCKDKDTLLRALLGAKGFTTAPALIGVGLRPAEDVPSPAFFNHVITTVQLPSGQIWLDSTPEVEPFQVLVPMIRDEQALVIPASGDAKLEKTPADPPFPFFEKFMVTGSLDKDGLLKSHVEMTLRSDSEYGFRLLLQRAAPSQWDASMQNVSEAMGFSGTVTGADLKQSDAEGPVHIAYDYTRASFADWDNHRILPLFPALEIAYIGKEKAPEYDIDLGSLRRLEAVTRLKLPPGYSADLPDAVHVKREYATFDKTYRMEKGELVMERTVVVLKKKVKKAEWKDYYAFTKELGAEGGENYISLTAPMAPIAIPEVKVPAASAAKGGNAVTVTTPEDAAIAQAMAQFEMLNQMKKGALALEVEGKWAAAQMTVELMRTQKPDCADVMSMLGWIEWHYGKRHEAISDYELELKNNPSLVSSKTVAQLATLYAGEKRYQDAETLIGKYLERNDVVLFTELAYVQTQSGDEAAALTTLQGALKTHLRDEAIEQNLMAALFRGRQYKEAAAVGKELLMSTQEAGKLNDAAYMMSEMKLEMPLAERSSRRAITIFETALQKDTIQAANEASFAQTRLLAASWDTLGWILFEEGKTQEAEGYLRAAWINAPDVEVGSHLGQVLEVLHRPAEAMAVDEMALVSDGGKTNKTESALVQGNIDRLVKAGTAGAVTDGKAALETMRTFPIAKSPELAGMGMFRVTLAGDGVKESHVVSGPQAIRGMEDAVSKVQIAGVVPPGSHAQMFHDGTLTCVAGKKTCDFQLVAYSGMAAEATP